MHWWVPETCTGHYMPAKISKISISPLLGCYYWLTELIHVSGYLTITNAHTVNVWSSNIVKNSCLQQTKIMVCQTAKSEWPTNATCKLTDCRQPGELSVIFVSCKSLYFSVIWRFLCLSNLSVVQNMSSSEVVNFNARQLKQEIYSKCVRYFLSFFLCSCYSCHCCFFP